MILKKSVIVRTSFEALHAWYSCPIPEVSYLRSLHRHLFCIEVKISETEGRGVEFIHFKHYLQKILLGLYPKDPVLGVSNLGEKSCEDVAEELFRKLRNEGSSVTLVYVDEDGENGAIVEE